MKELIYYTFLESADLKRDFIEENKERIYSAFLEVARRLKAGGKLLICGNGGSAADAQHIAAELVGRFELERPPVAAVALTTDTSVLTAVANDYSFASVFERQVEALGREGDVLLAISTSGNSENVVRAVEKAKEIGLLTVGFLGKDGGKLASLCHHPFIVKSFSTPRIQEVHITLGHVLCDFIEKYLFSPSGYFPPSGEGEG
ncbi:D-sedoheptulose 7-phosphate isomerase [Thermovibrio ammonificans]|jgi:D-sedoheptulose 7-phosphate isomerase|uniref:Phosphoheptose isomerase n=1 Tax=Thermovibrio ammonificans (strain DSM 15698 / JCM 12110 / HB-1) TaxID=648996 RepID=E8T574_THEA1|nr:D-sedoheptulose 7-phosphate isomerase [Thermovibrio ammonificans]ADU96412.1 phosphoheptose isomerase [Thermovibrio ammonificans HB-1]